MNITALVIVGDEAVPEPGVVVEVDTRFDRFSWRSTTSDWRAVIMRRNEGLTWIRGHHAPTSPEVAALKTAYALAEFV